MNETLIAAQGRMPKALLKYWRSPKGLAEIRPGTEGAFDRCVRKFAGFAVKDPKGTCANLIKNQTGEWPGEGHQRGRGRGRRAALTAAADIQTGAMVALVPSAQDAARLAVESGEDASQLHVTLAYLGEGADFDEMDREAILDEVFDIAELLSPFTAQAFGVAMFNPHSENACVVLNIGGQQVYFVHELVEHALEDYDYAENHKPYVAHLTLEYTQNPDIASYMDKLGPVRFEYLRVAFAGEAHDIPLGFNGFGDDDIEGSDYVTASVHANGWGSLSVTPRETKFNADDAMGRIMEWSNGDVGKLRQAFMWQLENADPKLRTSWRLPIGDIVNGDLVLVPAAVFSAGVILSGGHGGLEDVTTDADRKRLKGIVSDMYDALRERYSDPRVVAPWERGGNEREDVTASLDMDDHVMRMTLTASLTDVRPEASLFANPMLTEPTWLTVTSGGRVFGHAALWRKCHAGIGNECVMAPHSATNYAYFLNGKVLTADGQQIPVGKITMGTGHADTRYGWLPAADHYDNTGTVAAIVTVGEDEHGIWMAGVTVPGLPEEKVQELRRSPISGDWRRINGNLELVAALAVNTPGFPIIASVGENVETILAAGVLDVNGDVVADADRPDPRTAADEQVLKRLDAVDAALTKHLTESRKRSLKIIDAKLEDR